MREITIKLYKFSELSEDAQDKAVERLTDLNVDYDWWQFVYGDAENIGLKITSFDLDRNRHAKGKFVKRPYHVAEAILNDHGESCETYQTAKAYLKEYDKVMQETPEDEDIDTEEIDREFLRSLLEDYAIILEKECEYLTSREAIVETIEANDYEFTEGGYITGEI